MESESEFKGFTYELRPNGAQRKLMARTMGSCRAVYNMALAEQKEKIARDGKKFTYVEQSKHLTAWKKDEKTIWLKEVPSQALQQSLRDLDRAYVNFFEKRANLPKFKKKGRGDSFRLPQGVKIDETKGEVFIPKIGPMKYYNKSHKLDGKPKSITVRCRAGRWFMSVCTEGPRAVEDCVDLGPVGVDMGIKNFATLSDGTMIPPVNSLKKALEKLRRAQKALARKKKGSKRWAKARRLVAKIYFDIANIRLDHVQKVSTTVSKNHAVVIMEDLRIKNMTASASGTLEEPGTNVRQKSGLNRSILDQGWGKFRVLLEHKLKRRGGELILVPPHYTSQKCPMCGHTHKDNRKTQADFKCLACGYENNADIVGAMNVLAAGLAVVTACGEVVRPSGTKREAAPVKQEPTEETGRGLSLSAP